MTRRESILFTFENENMMKVGDTCDDQDKMTQ